MNSISSFLVYAVIFRLAIITVGSISIILGYKLFCRLVFISPQENSSVTVEVSGSKFTLQNAAPGAIFAMFGAIIVTVMLFQGNPQLTLETLNSGAAASTNLPTADSPAKLTLRGSGAATLEESTQQGREFERVGEKSKAVDAYEQAVLTMAEPLNDLAWVYQSNGRLEEASSLSTLAVTMRADPRFLDTLAEIKCRSGDHDAAVKLMERAVTLDPSPEFKEKLRKFKEKSGVCQKRAPLKMDGTL